MKKQKPLLPGVERISTDTVDDNEKAFDELVRLSAPFPLIAELVRVSYDRYIGEIRLSDRSHFTAEEYADKMIEEGFVEPKDRTEVIVNFNAPIRPSEDENGVKKGTEQVVRTMLGMWLYQLNSLLKRQDKSDEILLDELLLPRVPCKPTERDVKYYGRGHKTFSWLDYIEGSVQSEIGGSGIAVACWVAIVMQIKEYCISRCNNRRNPVSTFKLHRTSEGNAVNVKRSGVDFLYYISRDE